MCSMLNIAMIQPVLAVMEIFCQKWRCPKRSRQFIASNVVIPGTLFLLTSTHSNRLRAYKSTLVPRSYEGRQLKHEVLPYKLKDRDYIPGWCHISNLCYLAHTGSGLTQPPGKTFLPPGIKKVARQVSEECRRYEC